MEGLKILRNLKKTLESFFNKLTRSRIYLGKKQQLAALICSHSKSPNAFRVARWYIFM
jgi:hypothetical protein